ncbi:MAG: hypothetical protein L3I91_01860 [Mycoplasma sp.]
MPKLFKLKVNTPAGILFEDDILAAEIFTDEGKIVFLADHTPAIGSFIPSHCYFRDQKNNRVDTIINNGVFRFDQNSLNLFTDFFVFAKDANEDVFESRMKQIKEVLKEKAQHQKNSTYDAVQAKLEENLRHLRELASKK